MKLFKEKNMIRGWFIGDFIPSVFKTDACEVALKRYKIDFYESPHYHKIVTEITLIIKGSVKMNGIEYCEGDIIQIDPGESTDFKALSDVILLAVKIPGIRNDKYVP